ncbi:hypothetical protein AB0E62_27275 [Streptomyces sp. NPDC038707]|uniref:hypothetical protein n=1 Tax=Streptomyces sp. NPDC038707 TaxID=3154329 RepID=UPI00341044C4
MTDRRTASTITDTELDQLYNALDTLRAVARGYCEHCGRGDATPPPEAYEEQRARAARAEAALADVRMIASELFMAGQTQTEREIGRRLSAVLDQRAPAAATRATNHQEQ